MITPEGLTASVTAMYMADGTDHTVAEIAAATGWSESSVRRVFAAAHGCTDGLRATQESRPTYSKNYPAMEHGCKSVWVYGPTRAHLRSLIHREVRKSAELRDRP